MLLECCHSSSVKLLRVHELFLGMLALHSEQSKSERNSSVKFDSFELHEVDDATLEHKQQRFRLDYTY